MIETSVLAVTYDGERAWNLNAWFKSLAAQTDPASQIVLVLDGPVRAELTDVIERWSETLPVDLYQQAKRGLSHGLNLGLEKCVNNIVFRCDTDDICLPDRFQVQTALLRTTGASVVSGPVLELDAEAAGTRIKDVPVGKMSFRTLSTFFRNPVNHNCVAMDRNSVLAAGGYPEGRMEDYRLWLQMMKMNKTFFNSDKVLLHASAHGLGKRRVGTDYIAAEWALFKANSTRLGGLGFFVAALALLLRAPLRLRMMEPFITFLYAKVLRRAIS